jgi:DnaJ-class molecular chaperone
VSGQNPCVRCGGSGRIACRECKGTGEIEIKRGSLVAPGERDVHVTACLACDDGTKDCPARCQPEELPW